MAAELARSRAALLADATALLATGDIGEPRREAFRLWDDVIGGHPGEPVLQAELPVSPEMAARLLAAAARRAGGEPLAYATGRVGFRLLVLRSDARALIPRPETEGLVELVLQRVRTGRVADIGTGTGALALSLTQEGSFGQVIGIDLSGEALALAAENRRDTGLDVSLVRGDLCAPLATGSLDALVSNPPYLTEGEHAALDPAVRAWEPAVALVGGAEGLEVTRRVLDEGRRAVRPGGLVALEVDCSRAGPCARVAAELGWEDVAIYADLFGRERYLLARRSSRP